MIVLRSLLSAVVALSLCACVSTGSMVCEYQANGHWACSGAADGGPEPLGM